MGTVDPAAGSDTGAAVAGAGAGEVGGTGAWARVERLSKRRRRGVLAQNVSWMCWEGKEDEGRMNQPPLPLSPNCTRAHDN